MEPEKKDIDIQASQVAPVEPDLEALRDEKVFPIVRALMTEMGSDLVNAEDNHTPLTLKALSLMLDADLNVAQEVSYVPQIILGALAGLNRTLQECEANEVDDVRMSEIANKILAIVAEANVTLGEVTPEVSIAEFAPVKEKINDLFIIEDLSRLEVKYITDKIFNSFSVFNNLIQSSITNATERMEVKILGIETLGDLTLKKLNDVLVEAPAEEVQANDPAPEGAAE